uniref:Uncharacterized protein n=1 Tax=Alexandrium monilatum TaxID=311494 RepID=A0A7S4Q5M1_9DINO
MDAAPRWGQPQPVGLPSMSPATVPQPRMWQDPFRQSLAPRPSTTPCPCGALEGGAGPAAGAPSVGGLSKNMESVGNLQQNFMFGSGEQVPANKWSGVGRVQQPTLRMQAAQQLQDLRGASQAVQQFQDLHGVSQAYNLANPVEAPTPSLTTLYNLSPNASGSSITPTMMSDLQRFCRPGSDLPISLPRQQPLQPAPIRSEHGPGVGGNIGMRQTLPEPQGAFLPTELKESVGGFLPSELHEPSPLQLEPEGELAPEVPWLPRRDMPPLEPPVPPSLTSQPGEPGQPSGLGSSGGVPVSLPADTFGNAFTSEPMPKPLSVHSLAAMGSGLPGKQRSIGMSQLLGDGARVPQASDDSVPLSGPPPGLIESSVSRLSEGSGVPPAVPEDAPPPSVPETGPLQTEESNADSVAPLTAAEHRRMRRMQKKNPSGGKQAAAFFSSPGAISSVDRDASKCQGKFDMSSLYQAQLRTDQPCMIVDFSNGLVLLSNALCDSLFEHLCPLQRRDVVDLIHEDDRLNFSASIMYLSIGKFMVLEPVTMRMLTAKGEHRAVVNGEQMVGSWWWLDVNLIDEATAGASSATSPTANKAGIALAGAAASAPLRPAPPTGIGSPGLGSGIGSGDGSGLAAAAVAVAALQSGDGTGSFGGTGSLGGSSTGLAAVTANAVAALGSGDGMLGMPGPRWQA